MRVSGQDHDVVTFTRLLAEVVVFEATCVAQGDVGVRSSRKFCKRRSAEMREDEEEKGLLWRLPKLQTRDWGKMGPAFGYGIGCGVGLGVGIVGGAGIGLGFPGLQVGFGVGAGCGVGVGFGYGLGKGRAYDDVGTYSNVGRLPKRSGGSIAGSSGAEIGAIIDDFISGVKRALKGIENGNGKRR